MAGGSLNYSSVMEVAPQAGVAAAVLSTANPVGTGNANDGYNWTAMGDLLYDAANALTNPSLSAQPLPAALLKLLTLLNGTITQTAIAQTFSSTFISQNPSLATTLQSWQSSLGACQSFTVQRINSTYSANLTLLCSTGTKPTTLTTTTASPYLVNGLTL